MKIQKVIPYVFISPFFVLFAVFLAGPLGYAVVLSLYKFRTLLAPRRFVGLLNYKHLFADPRFLNSLVVIGKYSAIAIPVTLGIAILLAVLLNIHFKGRSIFRLIFFLPVITSLVAASIFFRLILADEVGILNHILRVIGLPGYRWLNDPKLLLPSLITVTTWRIFGFFLIIFLAALQNIPQELYEAAKVDGASVTQALFRITLPLLFPTIFFCIIIATIGSIQLFDEPYILFTTHGGVELKDEILTPAVYLYATGFETFRLPKAAAMGFIMSCIIFSLALLEIRLMGKRGGFGQ